MRVLSALILLSSFICAAQAITPLTRRVLLLFATVNWLALGLFVARFGFLLAVKIHREYFASMASLFRP
jgi:hypothetical protein